MIENFNYDKEHPPSFGEKAMYQCTSAVL